MTEDSNLHFFDKELTDHTKILIVEDDFFQRTVITKVLEDCGFLNIQEAVDGQDGLNKILEWRPDIVFLDIRMPKMSGLEVSRAIYENKLHHDIVIIVLTSIDDPNAMADAFAAGATDYIAKPINETEVRSRITSHLQRKRFKDKIESSYHNIQKELDEAMALQKILLPQESTLNDIRKEQNLDIAHYYQPSSQLGGDYISVAKLTENKTAIIMADVSGHGLAASLYAFALHAIVDSQNLINCLPGEALEKINRKLFSFITRGKFATFFLGVIDTESSLLEYASAAAPTPLLLSNNKVLKLETKGYLLGTKKDADYETYRLPFEKGDSLCLYSDALIETPNQKGELFCEDELILLVKEHKALGSNDSKDAIVSHFFENYSSLLSDDLSLLICKHI